MIEVVLNDRLGKKVRVKCNEDDTVGDLKKLVAAQIGAFKTCSSRAGSEPIPPLTAVRRPPSSPPQKPQRPNRHAPGEDPHPEVVHHLQGPHHAGRLRDPR